MKHRFLFAAALLFAATSCVENTIEDYVTPFVEGDLAAFNGVLTELSGNEGSITVAMSDASTRISVDATGEIWNTTWDSTDKLIAFYAPAGASSFTYYSSLYMDEYDPEVSTFYGSTDYAGWSRRLVYCPGEMEYIYANSKIYLNADITNQQEGLKHTFMIDSEYVTVAESDTATPSMLHINAAADLHIRFTNVPEGYYLNSVELEKVLVAVYADLMISDIDHDDFIVAYLRNSMFIDVEDRTVAEYSDEEDEESIKFNLIPFDIEAGDGLDIKFHFVDDLGYSYYATTTITNDSSSAISFKRGTYNTIYSTCDMSELVSNNVESTLSELSATSYPELDTWIITDTTAADSSAFDGLDAALSAVATADASRRISLIFSNLESLPDNALASCATSLSSVNAPEATSIGASGFSSCSALTTVNFPKVVTVGENAFYYCTSLTSVSLPAAESVGGYSFCMCSSLESITLESVQTVGEQAFYYASNLVSVSFPEALTIGDYSFYKLENLATISMPKLMEIGQYAFRYCYGLTSVEFPAVESISYYAFRDCTSLESISFPKVQLIENYTFADCSKVTVVDMPELITVNNGAFHGVPITTINMPKVEYVGTSVFNGAQFVDVELPSVTWLGGQSFSNCDKMETLRLPSLAKIYISTLPGCSSLKTFEMASNEGVEISHFGSWNYNLFEDTTMSELTFITSDTNESRVHDEVYFTAPTVSGDFEYGPFKEIVIVRYEDSGVEDFNEGSEI